MLQHNIQNAGRRAHVAHAAVVALHAVCCGMPILAMTAAGLSGITSGTALLSDSFNQFHGAMHAHETWIIAFSAFLVGLGGVLEVLARRGAGPRPFPWLFAVSVACFAFNLVVILAHRAV